jgi:hypothetical protein
LIVFGLLQFKAIAPIIKGFDGSIPFLRVAWAMPAPLAKMGKSALILRVLCTRKISALNKKCTSGMLPANRH